VGEEGRGGHFNDALTHHNAISAATLSIIFSATVRHK
jgi:hypothetical protein